MQRSGCLTAYALLVCFSADGAMQTSALSSVPGTGSLKPTTATAFTFIVAGDSRPAKADLPPPPQPGEILAAAKPASAAFVVWTGDTIYGLSPEQPDVIAQQYQAFFKLAQTAGVPVFTAPGNHEMDIRIKGPGPNAQKEVGSADMEALYRTNMGLAANAPIYGSFSYGNSHFVVLNTEEIPPAGQKRSQGAQATADLNLDPGYVSPAELQWLKQDLDANKAVHTFVFMHHPIKPQKSDMALDAQSAAALTKQFGSYKNISYVLASHEHLYYNPQTNDTTPPPNRTDPSGLPPVYLVSGGAGAPLVGTPATGGFYHYLVFQVNGNQVNARLVKLQ